MNTQDTIPLGITLRCVFKKSTNSYRNIAWSPDGNILATSSDNGTIHLLDTQTWREIRTLEGHTGPVMSISFDNSGQLLASKGFDFRVWDVNSWESVAIPYKTALATISTLVAFHPVIPILAEIDEKEQVIRIWDVDIDTFTTSITIGSSVHYTTAKIALVGDSGVGKSGLGYRIAEDRFKVTASTHGQQFWVVDQLGQTRTDGTQCEAVLWDFAGQPNFRPIHTLFLDEVDLALILFDPSRHDTFTGVEYWLKQLSYKGPLCRTVLVAARTDVSTQSFSSKELETFCRERKISGGFVATSANTGEGVNTLLDIILEQIDWDIKTATVTTETFKRIKDYVLTLKATEDRTSILVNPAKLRVLLQSTDQEWKFTDDEVKAAVGHLQTHGYVSILRRSAGEESILLTPDVLINLAARYMLTAQTNEKGLGALEEGRALRNEYKFPEVENLEDDERDTLLNAVTELFLKRTMCFRESVDNQTFLIFPSLILDRPLRMVDDTELVEDVTYIVTGLIENIYPALVVLLGYSPSFQRTNQWRKQAQYETVRGENCGFKLANDEPDELELVLYYGKNTPQFVRSRFQGLFEEILYTRDVTVKKYAPIICSMCNRQQESHTVIRLIEEGKTFLFCAEDGNKMRLPKKPERLTLSSEDRAAVAIDQTLSNMRTTYETALVRVKGFIRDRGDTTAMTCFISYAWGVALEEKWVQRVTDDLRKAGVDAVLDQLDNAAIGFSVSRFISRIAQSDFIVVVGTPTYRQKYENKLSQYGSVVAAEVDLINVRLTGTKEQKASVLPVLLKGEERQSFPPLLHRRIYGDFTREEYYFITLFDLILTLHQIPFDDASVRDLRAILREEAQELAAKEM